MLLEVGRIRSLAEAVLVKYGAPETHAKTQVDLLLEAELRGYASHGLLRLRRIVERMANGVTDASSTGRHDWLGRNYLSVDGGRGLGPVVAMSALDAILPRAREDGVAIAAVNNSNHIGMLAWYGEKIAARGIILIAATTSEALVHPWGGRKAMVGTNPLAIAIPAEPEPLVLDMATGLVSMGKIHDHANRGEAIPLGWALDAQGEPTTDAVAAKAGAIAPFGGAKGYALGLALEVLVTSLSAAAIGNNVTGTLDSNTVCNKGDIFIAIAPKQGEAAKRLVSCYLDEIRASEPATPGQPVSVPGDRARRTRDRAVAGGLNLDDGLWRDLLALEQSDPKIKKASVS